MVAVKIVWVPHSANATTRACGKVACSPCSPRPAEELRVHARVGDIETGPVDPDQPACASHTPGVCSPPIGLATCSNNAANGSDPNRARACKIADLLGGA